MQRGINGTLICHCGCHNLITNTQSKRIRSDQIHQNMRKGVSNSIGGTENEQVSPLQLLKRVTNGLLRLCRCFNPQSATQRETTSQTQRPTRDSIWCRSCSKPSQAGYSETNHVAMQRNVSFEKLWWKARLATSDKLWQVSFLSKTHTGTMLSKNALKLNIYIL